MEEVQAKEQGLVRHDEQSKMQKIFLSIFIQVIRAFEWTLDSVNFQKIRGSELIRNKIVKIKEQKFA